MTRPPALKQQVHDVLRTHLAAGDRVIDATMGNGHDTLLLARLVAPNGRVAAFDIQPAAVENTRQRLTEAGLLDNVTLHLVSHDRLLTTLGPDWPGRVAAVTFNLGYLPGGDKSLITRARTTVAALDQALGTLHPGGLLSLMLYRGHPGANEETAAVQHWLTELPEGCRVEVRESRGPILYLVRLSDPR